MTKTKKQTPRKAMETFGTLYCDEDVLKNMPEATGEPIEFFTLNKYVTAEQLEKEYESRGLVPASPYDLAAAHEADAELVKKYKFTGTQWRDKDEHFCYAAFDGWDSARVVHVSRRDDDWGGRWVFAGSRKSLGPSALDPFPSDSADAELSKAVGIVKAAGYRVSKDL